MSSHHVVLVALHHPAIVMARPFDDRLLSQYTGSSLSSQTSLATNRVWVTSEGSSDSPSSSRLSGDTGQSLNSRSGAIKSPRTKSGSRLAKIKSSPSNGALAAARKVSSHGRLHKRGNSASATQSPISPTFGPSISLSSRSPDANAFSSNTYSGTQSSHLTTSTNKTKVMIKPFLRKLSSSEQTSIDLSRSAAENEGLGIYNSSEISGSAHSDIGYGFTGPGGYHQRTTSGNSQISTISSSNHRYGTQYVHPMRQTPRPYTPSVAASYQTSLDNEASVMEQIRASSEGSPYQPPNTMPTPYAPLPQSLRRLPPPIHTRTGSSTYFVNSSQTNIPGTPSSLRRQTDFVDASDNMPSTARSSLESAFRKRNRANTDPAAHAATVAALRQKFHEKEAAKDLKIQQAEAKAQEREAKRREKREEEELRKSEGINRKRAKSNTTSEKSGIAALTEPTLTTSEQPFLRPGQPRRRPAETAGVAGKAVQSQWSLFWFKFKTMWLKLKRKLSKSST